jgi:tRNA (guanine37-N1)-methyltransferase
MLKFHVITLFPELIDSYCCTSIVGRGVTAGKIAFQAYNPRDFCQDKYRKVDDTPYGGGAGMVLKPEPIYAAVESITRAEGSPVLLMTPQGVPFQQKHAEALATEQDIVLICGHYEGFDERIRKLVTHEYSLGDFVLTGGELPALAIIDAVGRLVPGVLGKSFSLVEESFNAGLLEAPQYTKPVEFRGMVVPEVLRSGNHKLVAQWRRMQSLKRTAQRRPDLFAAMELSKLDRKLLEKADTDPDLPERS